MANRTHQERDGQVLEGGIVGHGVLGEGAADEGEEPLGAAGSSNLGLLVEAKVRELTRVQRPRQRRESSPVRTASPASGSSSRMRTRTSSPIVCVSWLLRRRRSRCDRIYDHDLAYALQKHKTPEFPIGQPRLGGAWCTNYKNPIQILESPNLIRAVFLHYLYILCLLLLSRAYVEGIFV
jgi:hypothetical protein